MLNEQYKPTPAEESRAEEMMTGNDKEMSAKRERILSRLKTAEGGASVITGARELGIPEEEVKAYALRVVAADARRGFDLDPVFTMARNTQIATREEVDATVKKALAERLREYPADTFAAQYVYGTESEQYRRAKEALAREKKEKKERKKEKKWRIQKRREERGGEILEYRIAVLSPNATFEDLLEAARSDRDQTETNLDDVLRRKLPETLSDAAWQEFVRLYMDKPELRKTTVVLDFFARHGYSRNDIETTLPIKFGKKRKKDK